jgi:hypothetical protein
VGYPLSEKSRGRLPAASTARGVRPRRDQRDEAAKYR